MIRFLYRAGSEKTRVRLTEGIKQDLAAGAQVLLLVPEQETVSVEKRMLEMLPPSAQLSFEVLNFSRLANRTFRALGGLSYRTATPAVSALLMWQTIGELIPFLKQYGATAARDSALCELMLKTEAQCKTSCIAPEELLRAAEALPEGEPLREKLHDIGMTLSTFESMLGQRFDNAADDLTRLAAMIGGKGKALFANTHIYIDSFTDFTAQELSVLRGLFAAAPSVTVTFPMENGKDNGLHLSTACESHKRLLRMTKELSLRIFTEVDESEKPNDAIQYLSRHLFDMTAEPAPLFMAESGKLSLCACPTPFEEAANAACQIHRLVRAGYRYRDITVVVREAADWIGILDAAFEKEGIPYFLSEKTDITTRPLIKLILEALRIRLGNWREEDVLGYLKTGLCGVSADDINLFEEYASVWHPRGEKAYYEGSFTKNPDGYSATVSERGKSILAGANRVRETIVPPLMTFFARMDEAKDATALCRALYDFLEYLHVRESLKDEAQRRLLAGERREAEELSKLYGVTVDALEAISTAIGEKKLIPAEFADALKLVFTRTDIGSIPTSADEVTVGSASMLRADHPKFVLVLGLNEGIFPRTVTDDGLLGDADKKKLSELGVEFPADNAKLSSDELFFIHRALRAPTEGLCFSYSTSGTDGRALSPSIAVERIKRLFPTLPEHKYAAEDPMNRIFSPASAMENLTELPAETANGVLRLLEKREIPGVQSMRRPVIDPKAAVSPDTAKRLFAGGRFNPTHLEKFSACRFAYYCSKILHLREEATDTMSAAEVGNFIHYVLEKAIEAAKSSPENFADHTAQMQKELVAQIAAEYRARLTEFSELTPRTEALLRRLTALAELIVAGLFAELGDSLFTPAFLELDLSTIGKRPSVQIGENIIPLSGKIDRVDFWQDNTCAYLRVTDYKTGTREFSVRDIEHGFSMQMPLYLMALCRGQYPELAKRLELPEDTVFHPAGINYLSSNVGTELTAGKRNATDALRDAVDRLGRSGLGPAEPELMHAVSLSGDSNVLGSEKQRLPQDGFELLFDVLEQTVCRIANDMRSGDAEACPNAPKGGNSPCNYCSFAPICRKAEKSSF